MTGRVEENWCRNRESNPNGSYDPQDFKYYFAFSTYPRNPSLIQSHRPFTAISPCLPKPRFRSDAGMSVGLVSVGGAS